MRTNRNEQQRCCQYPKCQPLHGHPPEEPAHLALGVAYRSYCRLQLSACLGKVDIGFSKRHVSEPCAARTRRFALTLGRIICLSLSTQESSQESTQEDEPPDAVHQGTSRTDIDPGI